MTSKIPQPVEWLEGDSALVVSTSRRWTDLCTAEGSVKRGTAATKALDITVGDLVTYREESDGILIEHVHPRSNYLARHVGYKKRGIAANVDRTYIVCSFGPLFNTNFIDRIFCAAHQQHIPTTLVVNKVDLEIDTPTEQLIRYYSSIGHPVIRTSARLEDGVQILSDTLATSFATNNEKVVCLAGVSGVGKSSLLNRLVPEAERETRQVSERTGQGRQTTSQAIAYSYRTNRDATIFLVDLPGVQNFGITHLTRQEIQAGIGEFENFSDGCEYADCYHTAEPNCAVKEAVEGGEIAPTRYLSYLGMLEELENFKEY